MKFRVHTLLAACVAALELVAPAYAHAAGMTNFKGQTITLVINYAPGGAVDTFFRIFVPALEHSLPGHPTVVVENRPGAAGRLAAAYLYNVAKPNGLTIGGMAGIASDAVATLDNKFDLSKFAWLGAVPQTQVTMIRKDLGVKDVKDLLSKHVILAGTGASSPNFVATDLAFTMMGIKFKTVQGYAGQAATVQALRQNEVNAADVGLPFYLPNKLAWRREGVIMPILQRGDVQSDGSFSRSPQLPTIETMPEAIRKLNPKALSSTEFSAYKMIATTYALQYSLIAPPGVPRDTVKALRAGVEHALSDPQAVALVERRLHLKFNFIDGEKASKLLAGLTKEAKDNPKAHGLITKLTNPQ